MKVLLLKYRKQIIIPATLALLLLGFVNIYFIVNITPRTNDECLWRQVKSSSDSIKIVFDLVKEGGITWNAGIRNGDEFLEIDGNKLRNTYHATYLADRKLASDSLNYKYARNGIVYVTRIPVKKLIEFGTLAFVLLGLIWLTVGFIVLSSKPYGVPQLLFYKIGAFFILFSSFGLLSGNSDLNPIHNSPFLLILIDLTWVLGIVFLPFFIVHFFWLWPLESKIIKKKYTSKILVFFPVIMLFFAVLYRIIFIYFKIDYTDKFIGYNQYFISFFNILLFISFLIGLFSLFRSYFKLEKPNEKNSIIIVLIGYSLGVAAIIYVTFFANVIADTIFNSPEYYLPIFLIILIPIGFGFSIFRYSLLDVSDVLKNTILYGTATFCLALVYFLIIYVLGQTISEALTTDYQGIVAAGIFIIFAFIFQSTKDKFQNVITKYFYPEQFAYQKVLIKFSNDVSTIVGLDNILDSVQETFLDSLKVDKFGIALKNDYANEFILVRQDGFNNSNIVFTDEDNIISSNITNKLNVKHQAAFDQSEFITIFPFAYKLLEEEGIYTIVPLLIQKKVIGLLLFGLKYSGAQFAQQDIELLIAAANQTAIAIENARLYGEEAKKIKIERELIVAKQIQEGMLPLKIPYVKNIDLAGIMIPAMQIGGDYYDFIKVSDTQMFIIVADVSGKGLSASFYMSKLQTMIQLFCTTGKLKSPKEILVEVNRKITGNIEKQWFITLSMAFVDVAKRTIKICRAGHTPIIKFSNSIMEFIRPKGIAIGLESSKLFEDSLEELETPITPRDIFVFSSDGMNEAMNNENELFGYEKFKGILVEKHNEKSKEIINASIKSLEKFRGSKEPTDDITIVVLKII